MENLRSVEGQLAAYNSHDLAGYLVHFTENVTGFDLDRGVQLFDGKPAMAEIYRRLFDEGVIFCEIVNRMVLGSVVIDHEQLSKSGTPSGQAIVIYDLAEDGLICRMRITRGQPQ